MKRLIHSSMSVAPFLALAVLMPSVAGATTYRQTISPDGVLQATKPFQSFGNLSHIGDCQYETDANMILSQWPKAKITTSEVVHAYNVNGSQQDSNGLWAGQNYLITHGFDGHRATSIVAVTPSQIHGLTQVMNLGPVRMHTFFIIWSNSKQLITVDDGYVNRYNWAEFNSDYTQQGETLTYYAVSF